MLADASAIQPSGANRGLVANALSAWASVKTPPATAVNIIDMDDCSADLDCVFTQAALHHWINSGAVNVLAFIADSANARAAPLFEVFEQYCGHTGPPIGAFQGSTSCINWRANCAWNSVVVNAFNIQRPLTDEARFPEESEDRGNHT